MKKVIPPMNNFKSLDELTQQDKYHEWLDNLTGNSTSLEEVHGYLSDQILNKEVPGEIHVEFNMAKNMALYSYFCCSLSRDAQLKIYYVTEYALQIESTKKRKDLSELMTIAIANKWIFYAPFGPNIYTNEYEEQYKLLCEAIKKLRVVKAHCISNKVKDCLSQIIICTNFINKLYPSKKQIDFDRDAIKPLQNPRI